MEKVKFLVVGLLVWGLMACGIALAQGPVQECQQLAAAMQLAYSHGAEGGDCRALASDVYYQILPKSGAQVAQTAYALTKQVCTMGHQDRANGITRLTQIYAISYNVCVQQLSNWGIR